MGIQYGPEPGLIAATQFATRRPRAWLYDHLGPRNSMGDLEAKSYAFRIDNGRAWVRVCSGSESYELPDHVSAAWGSFSISGIGVTPRRPAGMGIDRKTREALLNLAGGTARPACPNYAVVWSLLFDAFGTSPEPALVRRFVFSLLPGPDLEAAATIGFTITGLEIAEWLDADCVVDHGPDNYCVLADSEGLVRSVIRARRGL